MNNNFITIAYLLYLPVALTLTWLVARTLYRNGRVFMLDIFHGRSDIAESTNTLFKIDFYLLNVGFALMILRIDGLLTGYQTMIEVLSIKIGGFAIYLGIMLFFNLYLFFRGRRASRRSPTPEPAIPAV